MRIAIDVTSWWNRRGYGRFTREIVKALLALDSGHRFVLVADGSPDETLQTLGADLVIARSRRSVAETAVASGRRRIPDILALSHALRRSAPDVVFFPTVWSWFPSLTRRPTVLALHDAIAERFPELVFPDRRGRLLWNLKVKLACAQSHRYLTVSEAARHDLEQVLRLPAHRIDVVSEAADAVFAPVTDPAAHRALRSRLGVPEESPVILYVGGLAPHKNLTPLIQAFDLARRRDGLDDARLVLTGDPAGDGFHSNVHDLMAAVAARPGLAGRVVFTGFVPDEELPTLYSTAAALALPSVAEGFGLPAVEAMACRTPVLCSRATSVAEVADDAALIFPHDDVAAMARAITTILADPEVRERLAERAIARSRNFSWRRAAELTLRSLERTAGGAG